MNRLVLRIVAFGVAAALAGCGRSHGSFPASGLPSTGSGTTPSASVMFTFTFPKPAASATGRSVLGTRAPKYLSSATQSITLQITDTKNAGTGSDIYAGEPSVFKSVQVANFANLTGNPTTPGQCGTDPVNTGNYECTATFLMPIGIDTTKMSSWDATQTTSPICSPSCSGHLLSQQMSPLTVVAGVNNSFNVSLDANVGTIVVNVTSGFCAGAFAVSANQSVGGAGTNAVRFNVATTDAAGQTIPGSVPGEPLIEVSVNGGTGITGSGASNGINVVVNQTAQYFTLAATNATTTTTEPITLTVTHNPADGLTFNNTLAFTFSAAPSPGPGFLALVEQTNVGTTSSGQIDLLTANSAANPSSFSAYTHPTLARNGTTPSDIDNPQSMIFDGNGDLLIANGGAGKSGLWELLVHPRGISLRRRQHECDDSACGVGERQRPGSARVR